MSNMSYRVSKLTTIDLSNLDTSNVTDCMICSTDVHL